MTIEVSDGQARVTDQGEYRRSVLLLAFVYGLLCVLRSEFAPLGVRALPGPSEVIFGLSLILGSTMAAEGSRRGLRGALIETTGLCVLTLHGAFYVLWTASAVGTRSLVTMVFLGGALGLPSAMRAVNLWRWTHRGGRLDRVLLSLARSQTAQWRRTVARKVGGFLTRRRDR